jgi:DNA-binding transcriptional regulator YiaG
MDIRKIRASLNLSQDGLARALHMGRWGFQTVGKWERGERKVPPHYAALLKQLANRQK